MIEQDDHVAVRYRVKLSGSNTAPLAMLGIYRFEAGRIAEDWGLSSTNPWRRELQAYAT